MEPDTVTKEPDRLTYSRALPGLRQFTNHPLEFVPIPATLTGWVKSVTPHVFAVCPFAIQPINIVIFKMPRLFISAITRGAVRPTDKFAPVATFSPASKSVVPSHDNVAVPRETYPHELRVKHVVFVHGKNSSCRDTKVPMLPVYSIIFTGSQLSPVLFGCETMIREEDRNDFCDCAYIYGNEYILIA